MCIPSSLECNGNKECPEGSDENERSGEFMRKILHVMIGNRFFCSRMAVPVVVVLFILLTTCHIISMIFAEKLQIQVHFVGKFLSH